MKKYFLWLISFFTLALLCSFSPIGIVEAVPLNGVCEKELGIFDPDPLKQCDPGLYCDPDGDESIGKGVCKLDESDATCSCTGQNTFTCTLKATGQKINDSCELPKQSCINSSGKGSIIRGKLREGVRCEEKKQATCKCTKPGQEGAGNNGFNCTIGNETKKDFCQSSDDACYDDPNATAEGYEGVFDGAILKGVKCTLPVIKEGDKCIIDDASKGYTCRSADLYCDVADDAFGDNICKKQPKENEACKVDKGTDPCKNIGLICSKGKCTKPSKVQPTLPAPPPPPCADDTSDGNCNAFLTAFGKVETDPEKFIIDVFAILLSISGAIALLLIIRAGYTVMTSQGKPDQLNAGREQLIATIVGLLFLILSFVILQVIGVDILKIPTDKGVVGGASCTTSPGGGTQESCPAGYSCNASGAACDDPSGRCPGTCTPN